jgi:uncharacterized protein
MRIQEIWRYPVKSMAGEMLTSAVLDENGIRGDRLLQVRDAAGQVITSRTNPGLLAHQGSLDAQGGILVDGRPWKSTDVARDIETAAGKGAHLVESEPEQRFDILPLLIATDGKLAAVGYDRRRFRPNLIIEGVEGLSERDWEGGQLRIGSVVVQLEDLRTRCIMTTYDPDTQKRDVSVLQRIRREFDGRLGLNASVLKSGSVEVGCVVEFLPAR